MILGSSFFLLLCLRTNQEDIWLPVGSLGSCALVRGQHPCKTTWCYKRRKWTPLSVLSWQFDIVWLWNYSYRAVAKKLLLQWRLRFHSLLDACCIVGRGSTIRLHGKASKTMLDKWFAKWSLAQFSARGREIARAQRTAYTRKHTHKHKHTHTNTHTHTVKL